MDAREFRGALARLGYSQAGFAGMVGASPRTGQKWALGEARIPGSVVLLLRLMLARPELQHVIDNMAPVNIRSRRNKTVE